MLGRRKEVVERGEKRNPMKGEERLHSACPLLAPEIKSGPVTTKDSLSLLLLRRSIALHLETRKDSCDDLFSKREGNKLAGAGGRK